MSLQHKEWLTRKVAEQQIVDAAAWCHILVSTSSKEVEDYRAEFSGI